MSKERKIGKLKDINVAIGFQIAHFRAMSIIPRKDVAKYLGVTEQQLFKYEKGQDLITAARLKLVADFFNVSIDVFFYGIEVVKNFSESQKSDMLLMDKKIARMPNSRREEAMKNLLKLSLIRKKKA